MVGYRGVGGEIDGIRNPTLWARTGETVRITIVNGELMVHDIALEKLDVKSAQILDKGASTSITFKANGSDTYYCSLPGHRAAGMEGRLDVSDEPRVQPEGVAPDGERPAAQPGFRDRHAGELDGDRRCVRDRQRRRLPGGATRPARTGQAGTYWVSSGAARQRAQGHARVGAVPRHPSVCQLSRVRRRLRQHARRARARPTTSKVDLHHLRRRPAPRCGRPSSISRPTPARTSSSGWSTTRPARPTATYLKENPVGAHQLRPLPLPRRRSRSSSTRSRRRTSARCRRWIRSCTPACRASKRRSAMTRAEGLHGQARGRRSRTSCGRSPSRSTIAAGCGSPRRTPIPSARRKAQGNDRILILEDTNGDGRLDSRKVFIENLNLVSGIEVGFGGVWVGAAPYLLFIPDRGGDGRPAGPAAGAARRLGIPGHARDAQHVHVGARRLALRHARRVHALERRQAGRARRGAPAAQRRRSGGSIRPGTCSRCSPKGTSNPWGLDFNDYGHAFTTACVIEHLYHVIQGARYKRQAGQHFNPYTYDDIKTIADHVHWVGTQGAARRQQPLRRGRRRACARRRDDLPGRRQLARGVPRHDLHEQHPRARTNTDRLQRKGSGYAATHGPDFLKANDSWSQMINFRYGPDGSVYVIDWYDKNQCHSTNPDVHEKTLGRIFKISHDERPMGPGRSDEAVVGAARRPAAPPQRLVRAARAPHPAGARPRSEGARAAQDDAARQPRRDAQAARAVGAARHRRADASRTCWSCSATTASTSAAGRSSCWSRARQPSDAALEQFATMARQETSALVRLYLASALQRVPAEKRWDVVAGLLAHAEDRADHNLPLMVWYAAEPLAEQDAARADAGVRVAAAADFFVHGPADRGDPDARRAARPDGAAGTHHRRRGADRPVERADPGAQERAATTERRASRALKPIALCRFTPARSSRGSRRRRPA